MTLSANRYFVDRIWARDASAIARAEADVYPKEHRAGRKVIWSQLMEAEENGENISLGLFCGQQLVGFLLLFVLQQRRDAGEYFGIELPTTLDLTPRVMYLADVVIMRAHRKAMPIFRWHLLQLLSAREDLRALRLDAFATEERARYWAQHSRFIAKLGVTFKDEVSFYDPTLKQSIRWLSYTRAAPPLHQSSPFETDCLSTMSDTGVQITAIRSIEAWDAIKLDWDRLLDQQTEPNLLHGFSFVRTWWSHFEFDAELFILVASKNNAPVWLLPLQIVTRRRLGKRMRYLTFIGQFADTIDLPFAPPNDPTLIKALADYLAQAQARWDAVSLTCSADVSFLKDFARALNNRGYTTWHTSPAAPLMHGVNSLRNAPWTYNETATCHEPLHAIAAVNDFFATEQPTNKGQLVDRRYHLMSIKFYFEDLAHYCSSALELCIAALESDDKTFGKCIGLRWRGVFYPLRTQLTSPLPHILQAHRRTSSTLKARKSEPLSSAPIQWTAALTHPALDALLGRLANVHRHSYANTVQWVEW